MHRLLLLAAIALVPAASAPASPLVEAREVAPAPPAVHSTWGPEEGRDMRLADRVEAQVRRELARSAPEFDLARLADYAAAPRSLPRPLNTRANQALWQYVPVLLVRGQEDLALATVGLLRDPKANLNPKVLFQGALTLAELRRRTAPSPRGAETAVRQVLGDLSGKRFHEATATLRTLVVAAREEPGAPLPGMLSSSLEQLTSYPVTPRAAARYLEVRQVTRGIWEHVDLYERVFREVRLQAESRQPRPWRFATVNMEDRADVARPVVIGILDSGVAPARYNMYENDGEEPNGLDDDGNGVVDDVSGLVWDWDPRRRHQHTNLDHVERLPPDLVEEYEAYLVGSRHRAMGWDTPEAEALDRKLVSLRSAEEQRAFARRMGEVGEWAHGTHVAGLAVAGNRWAQVATFRFAWTGESRIYFERGPSDAELRWERESIEELVAWLNAHEVRILNASVGFSVEYQAQALARERDVFEPDKPAWGRRDAEGRLTQELDLERIQERAEQIQAFRRESWRMLFEGCPHTLFVLAAGNEDHDVGEYQDVPVTIPSRHDNVLVVGAVDGDGEWASFTNFGEGTVQLYDLGVDVTSWSPTGRMIPMSGTSMAAPNATNTAGKILALHPGLTPAEVKAVLIDTADPIRRPFHGGIVDEVAAVARAERLARERGPAADATLPAAAPR